MISFEDFLKLDLRVGRILEVKYHPKADKLYILNVDIGEKTIQIVAGLRQFYNPEDLKNRLIVVVVNLEPKEIRGFISEGMLLAAQGKDNKISIIAPIFYVEPGSKIK